MQPEIRATRQKKNRTQDLLLIELESQIGSENFKNWFADKTTFVISNEDVTVGVGSPFLLSWMQKHFRSELTAVAQLVLGPSARVTFEVDARVSLTLDSPSNVSQTEDVAASPAKDTAAKSPAPQSRRRFADLASFVEGPCNELPLAATRQVCDSPGAKLNPLFLHGGVGTGKSHLLEGIYRQIRRRYPSLQVTFLTSEAFANYFTQALREHSLPSFRQRFRNVDVLLVDDIDFFDGKRGIQQEFLHTFQQLASHGRQIVLTSDSHPRLLAKLSDELTTRFLSGLVCRIEAPDLETRKRIVDQKASRMEAKISNEALQYVATRFVNNVRELEGALNCLATFHSMTKKRVTLTHARKVLADLERDCVRIVRMADVEQTVCNFFGIESVDLKSARRHRSVSQPRMLAMFLIRKYTRAAYSEIGEYFGGRNHATVISAEKKVKNWLTDGTTIKVASNSWRLEEVLETLEQQLQAC